MDADLIGVIRSAALRRRLRILLMSLRIAVQMDPLHSINVAGDSTFALMLSAQARGHTLWYYDVGTLAWDRRRTEGARLGMGRAGDGPASGEGADRISRWATLPISTLAPTLTWC
jgi:glutathione synthase